ncbi:integral membrane protein [Fusarium austroafricanum]|uniref:Integral membrane protein n=1 Tax=Fusarium austroafricanum TaxID=2364996 RepID=A0A8H4NZ27_9HYPO|nr:integral membrane protein [Fusarium austroafricanum]
MLSILGKVTACVVFLVCLVWYGQTNFYRDPGSVFFDQERAYETSYSDYRKNEARELIEWFSKGYETSPKDVRKKDKSLCVAFSSVKRQTQYLPVTALHRQDFLSADEREDIHVSVLIAETNVTNHPNWNEPWLREAVDDAFTYEVNSTTMASLREFEKKQKYSEKGVFDYTYAMERCYDSGALYVGMFEDDILLARGWLIKTIRGLGKIPVPDKNWLFMRLFNQERSTGFSSREIGDNNEFLIILGVGVGLSAVVLLARRRWRTTHRYLDLEALFVIVFLLVPGLVIFIYQSGKASIFPPSAGVFNEPFGCCSQAMIFPRTQIPLVVDSLRAKKHGQIDLMLDEIAATKNLDRYALYPVQAQHIGAFKKTSNKFWDP